MTINKRQAIVSIAAAGILLAGVGFWSMQAAQKVWLAKFMSAGGCSCMAGSSLTWSGWFTLGIAGLFALGLIAASLHMLLTLVRTRKIMQALKKCAPSCVDGIKFYRVSDKRCGAFTFGFLSPKIVLCDHCARALPKSEIEAMLKHEQYHVLQRDPLRFFILEIIKRMYFFAPILYPLAAAYRTAAELQADEAVADRDSLGRALLHVTAKQKGWAGEAAFASALQERIERLVNPRWKMRIRIPSGWLVFSGTILAFMIFLLSGPSVQEVRGENNCAANTARSCVRTAPSYGARQGSFPSF